MKKECFLSYNKALPIVALAMVLLLAFALLIPINSVYADSNEYDGNEYVNFNQLVFNNLINSTYSGSNAVLTDSNNYNGHKLLVRFKPNNAPSGSVFYLEGSGYQSILFSFSGSTAINRIVDVSFNINAPFKIWASTQFDYTYMNIIDLSLMFGIGREPSQEVCDDIFIADYYNYTNGTTITLEGLENYSQGVAQAMSSMQYTEISSDLANNMDTCVVNNDFGSTSKALIQGFFVWGNNTYTNTTAILGLGATLLQNDYITFKYKLLGSQSTLSLPPSTSNMGSVYIYGLSADGIMYKLATCEGYVGDTFKEVSFRIPFDLENLYLVADGQGYIVAYNNFELDITTMNLTAVLNHAFNQGQKQAKSYYSIGNEGYSQIYNQGVADGLSQGNAFASGLSIIGTTFTKVGEIMQLEILPNIPLSVFVLLPLMVGLIVFIVKMTKGS